MSSLVFVELTLLFYVIGYFNNTLNVIISIFGKIFSLLVEI